uniref:Uncharacterized protein n=1 Tax=Spumella sp. Baekdong012001B8 TaxID=2782410 RepID=A0A7S6PV97_9STRA|nr:hypothetical protein SpumellaPt_p054 [Spumella sp. Baekdong012001B8]
MKTKTKNFCLKKALWEKLQLTLIYFCILLFLSFRAKVILGRFTRGTNNLRFFSSLGGDIPRIKKVPKPENLLVLYAALLRPITNVAGRTKSFSFLVKFNLILVLLFEMLQFLFLDFWDILFKKISSGNNPQLKKTNIIVYSFIFSAFGALYSYCYVNALFGKIPTFPGALNVIPRSAQYWVKSKVV